MPKQPDPTKIELPTNSALRRPNRWRKSIRATTTASSKNCASREKKSSAFHHRKPEPPSVLQDHLYAIDKHVIGPDARRCFRLGKRPENELKDTAASRPAYTYVPRPAFVSECGPTREITDSIAAPLTTTAHLKLRPISAYPSSSSLAPPDPYVSPHRLFLPLFLSLYSPSRKFWDAGMNRGANDDSERLRRGERSLVNKFFRKIALIKQLWVVLMQNLVTNGLLVPPSEAELALYSTADIINDMKRIVHGPQTWEPAATLPPIIHRQITFDLHLDAASLRGIQLLPGGKYAVVETSNAVKLYAIPETRCIWEKPAPKVRSMATDMSCDGSVLRILLAPKQLSQTREFIIHEVDITSGHSHEVFTLPMPPENIFDMWWCIDLQENLFLIQTMTMGLARGHMFILIDWYTSQQFSPQLIANHILAMGKVRIPQFEGLSLLVTAIADLEHYWHPLKNLYEV
ncbi:hypothetical protein R3P38DRAFT_3360704 [Favolaschia claudopus]|uniref:Uncharacterized protein n=1 Tax=Favolaschia claudopus TaxID=2862362 RepID=A0AAW0AUU2_9AGAR